MVFFSTSFVFFVCLLQICPTVPPSSPFITIIISFFVFQVIFFGLVAQPVKEEKSRVCFFCCSKGALLALSVAPFLCTPKRHHHSISSSVIVSLSAHHGFIIINCSSFVSHSIRCLLHFGTTALLICLKN